MKGSQATQLRLFMGPIKRQVYLLPLGSVARSRQRAEKAQSDMNMAYYSRQVIHHKVANSSKSGLVAPN